MHTPSWFPAIAAQAQPPAVDEAATSYRQALDIAEELGMRPLLAHRRCGLGTLYAKLGQQGSARTELSGTTALYRAMDLTFWLPQTEAMLAQAEGR
jgi:hypothetical protein